MSKSNFLKGAAILGIAGFIVKILGAIYRIPIANMIGDTGMGYYQSAYPLYTLMFALSTAGIPVAIAKIVSEKNALGDYRGAQRVFKISFIGLAIGGILTSSFVFIGAKFIADKVGNSNSYYAMLALAPALLFTPIMSAFRGYFQGRQDMTPTAVSQVIEQLSRVSVGLILVSVLLKLDKGLPMAAGGASFGASAGALLGTITILYIYFKRRRKIRREIRKSPRFDKESTNKIIKDILSIAIPITIGASVIPLFGTIDVAIVMRRLQDIGYTEVEASGLYGQLTGMAQTLINFPQVFSVAIAASLVPAISTAFARRDFREIRKTTTSGFRVTLLIGLPAAMGLFVLANPIVKLLYFSNPIEVQESAGSILQVLAFSVIFLTLVQSLTAILQGMGKPFIPVRNLIIGALVKVVIVYVLTGIPEIGIKGAAISTITAYSIAAILNFIAVKRYTKIKFNIINMVIKPIASVAIMTIIVWFSYNITNSMIGNKLATLVAIGFGGISYGLALLMTGAITSRDFELLPGGNKLSIKLRRIGLLRK
ncbi:polysaccharide biosynthesis protein [Clostridium sp. D2Q-11]|uniref:Polysaccharide biosynthesis protein n=1 Tax=Anaeromonas frigoriresistens TaxID=2683708 RepID=A0A942Z852_9FIRM|nr:polysaccharide biosynthesis protein [Anaeromonas frigoriresistens]MBS4537590.1 polysaccharide biosynthesis protein [Anaeromonas frigoriresistens]